jgi:hypothetical protein
MSLFRTLLPIIAVGNVIQEPKRCRQLRYSRESSRIHAGVLLDLVEPEINGVGVNPQPSGCFLHIETAFGKNADRISQVGLAPGQVRLPDPIRN